MTNKMMKAAVLGHPISHSLSPKLHLYWLNHHQINGHYEAIETAPEALEKTLTQLSHANFKGVNLTVPLKENVLPFLDEIDETAKIIGAVNTVIFSNGKLKGYNTDAYGFIKNLESKNYQFNDSSAFIFGAGGAARAVIISLIQAGVKKIMICNRNKLRAETLEKEISLAGSNGNKIEIKIVDWEDYSHHLPFYNLIINTTSLGMKNQPPLLVDFSECDKKTLVTDIVYNPLQTPFLQNAKNANLQTKDGLGMLLYQGQKAFELFYETLPEVTENLRMQIISTL